MDVRGISNPNKIALNRSMTKMRIRLKETLAVRGLCSKILYSVGQIETDFLYNSLFYSLSRE